MKNPLRRAKFLMGKHPLLFIDDKFIKNVYDTYPDFKTGNWSLSYKVMFQERMEILETCKSLGMSDQEICKMWNDISKERRKSKQLYESKPKPEGRDNKDVHVGTGGSNKNKVRYPSKKRSIRTWKKFYALFPYCAKEDGFDGKTSSRMK